MAIYQTKPMLIEAVRLDGEDEGPSEDVVRWLNQPSRASLWESDRDGGIVIKTDDGMERANPGDYVLHTVNGRLLRLDPDVFEQLYWEPFGDMDRAKTAYAAYGEVLGWKDEQGNRVPQFSELSDNAKRAWTIVCDTVLRYWLLHDYRLALQDLKRVEMSAFMMKIGNDAGDAPLELVRRTLMHFVANCIAPDMLAAPGNNEQE